MQMIDEAALENAWARQWTEFDRVLTELEEPPGRHWDLWAFAVFLDVPSLQIAELMPLARAAGLLGEFDLEEKVRAGVARAMACLRERGEEGADRPLPLEFGLTRALLEWDWGRMEAEGEPPWAFFERVRELRQRLPEVALCELATYRFLGRVPPPTIAD